MIGDEEGDEYKIHQFFREIAKLCHCRKNTCTSRKDARLYRAARWTVEGLENRVVEHQLHSELSRANFSPTSICHLRITASKAAIQDQDIAL